MNEVEAGGVVLLEEVQAGIRLNGVVPGEVVTVIAATRHGADAVEVTFKRIDGGLAQTVLYRADEAGLSLEPSGARPFDADANDFKLVAEVQRIKLAGLFDPMLAVATSDIQPLPHQIRAVYGELLPRTGGAFLNPKPCPPSTTPPWNGRLSSAAPVGDLSWVIHPEADGA